MKRKHLYVILAILAVGLLLYAPSLVRGPDGGPAPAPDDLFALEGLEADAATEVRIVEAAGDTVTLQRTARGWRVNGHEADSAKVLDLLAALDTMTAAEVVARNPENHARLQVTAETGRTVELRTASGERFAFLVGSRELGTGGYHVRRLGEDRVWLLRGPVGGYTGRRPENWRERVVARVDTGRVREILLRRDEVEVVLRRDESGWTLGDDTPADSAATGALLRQLPELLSAGFPPDSVAAEADFGEPDAVLSVFSEDDGDVTGRTLVLSLRFLRGEDDRRWLAKRADEPEVYQLSDPAVEALLPTREKLEGDASPGS